MLRGGRYLRNKVRLSQGTSFRPGNAKSLSTDSAGSGGGRVIAAGGTVVLAGSAVSVLAAWQNPGFRRMAEENFPPAKYLFDPFLGPIRQENTFVSKPKPSGKEQKPKDVFEAPLKVVRKQEELEKQEPQQTGFNDAMAEFPSPLTTAENESENFTGIQREVTDTKPPEEPSFVAPSPPVEEVKADDHPMVESRLSENENSNSQDSVEDKNVAGVEAVKVAEEETVIIRTPEEIEENLMKLEEEALADQAAISTILDEALSSCASHCSVAIESNKEAAKAILLHTSLLKRAMDDTKTESDERTNQWMDLSGVLEQKSRLQKGAELTSQDARQELIKLEAVISQLKNFDGHEVKRKIIDAEENCNAMRKELEASAKDINVKLSESHVISEYKDLVDTAKEQFRQELLSVMPDVKLESGWRKLGQKLSTSDLNALIAHAHRRVDQLQRELAEERAISMNRVEMAVRGARERWDAQAAEEMEKTVHILKREAEIEHDKNLEEVRQAFENEMRIQLKRQAAAHSDHLTDMLGIQEKQIKSELGVEFEMRLAEHEQKLLSDMEELKSKYEEELTDISEKFQFDLNKALAKVAGIETAVDGRAYVENESRKAQELWLACEALRIAVQYGDNGKPVSLHKELQAIEQVPGVEGYVVDVIKAFPEKANERGVFTEDALRSAYKQVSKMCRRLSLISETRNSFFDYFLSYLKSLLIINRAQMEPPQDLDPATLDTFSILSYATYCLENGDLEQATRFLNQLTGESRRVAEGWLDEARLLLETRQVVSVLSSFASATTIAANLEI